MFLQGTRLNKFDKPKLYKEPWFVQIGIMNIRPSVPETAGADQKKSECGKGVIGMIDTFIAELAKELTEPETAEKLAQKNDKQQTSKIILIGVG